MLSLIKIRNFKAIKDVSIDLERFTVFIGPNASGKTSILEGIDLTAQLMRWSPPEVPAHAPDLKAAVSGPELQLHGRAEDTEFSATIQENHVPPADRFGSGWFITRQIKRKGAPGKVPWINWGEASDVAKAALAKNSSSALLRLERHRLAAPSYSESLVPAIDPRGAGLASALLHLKANNDEAFAALEDTLRRIVPAVRKIRFDKATFKVTESDFIEINGTRKHFDRERTYFGDSLVFETVSGPRVAASQMSEGTLLLLGLLGVLYGPTRPQIVLIDDLDRAWHPRAQRDIVTHLRTLLDEFKDLQIIATTHSPYLLDAVQVEEVRVTTLADEGRTRCVPLNEHPEMEKWKVEMSAGEFWSVVGESWVSGATRAGTRP